jgi:hypothetical protein
MINDAGIPARGAPPAGEGYCSESTFWLHDDSGSATRLVAPSITFIQNMMTRGACIEEQHWALDQGRVSSQGSAQKLSSIPVSVGACMSARSQASWEYHTPATESGLDRAATVDQGPWPPDIRYSQ